VGSTFLLSSHRREKEERNRFIAVLFRESCRTVKFSEYDREEVGAPAAYGGQEIGTCAREEAPQLAKQ
jgi:hypothetical protein